MKPPLLPAEALRRVLRLARMDGMSMLCIAGAFALASASLHDQRGMAVGLLVAAAGAIELHGGSLIRNGEARGMRWLVCSQVYLLAVILGYVQYRLSHVNIEVLRPLLTADQRQKVTDAGITVDEFLRAVYVLTYGVFAAASVVYQGGMAIYYLRRRAAVAAALVAE